MAITLQEPEPVAAGLLREILRRAVEQGLSQNELAERASLPGSSISRIKSTGRADLETIRKLAAVVGLRLALLPDQDLARKVSKGELL